MLPQASTTRAGPDSGPWAAWNRSHGLNSCSRPRQRVPSARSPCTRPEAVTSDNSTITRPPHLGLAGTLEVPSADAEPPVDHPPSSLTPPAPRSPRPPRSRGGAGNWGGTHWPWESTARARSASASGSERARRGREARKDSTASLGLVATSGGDLVAVAETVTRAGSRVSLRRPVSVPQSDDHSPSPRSTPLSSPVYSSSKQLSTSPVPQQRPAGRVFKRAPSAVTQRQCPAAAAAMVPSSSGA
mmetsp:Transcript_30000/g.79056  ORF Transcript_30000/g.79056 Transcript_30000/m.79056 type:complete len:244 (+) Transcript_30000:1419-2150(+)